MQQETRIESLRENLLKKLKAWYSTDHWLVHDFGIITKHSGIKNELEEAFDETVKRRYMNKHGLEHGLTVALNSLELFMPIKKGKVHSDYLRAFGNLGVEMEHVLFAILVASYIHDVGRFYEPSISHVTEISYPLEVIKGLASPPSASILRTVTLEVLEAIVKMIRELCLCHNKKDEKSGRVEIALIKLADALDCSKERVYTKLEKPELNVDHSKKMRTIFLKDERPELYFGSLSVHSVTINWNEYLECVEIVLDIKNYAASLPIKTIRNVLTMCERSGEMVERFSKRIWVYIKENEKDKYLLFPRNISTLPGIVVERIEYKIYIENKDGDIKIKNTIAYKNEANKDGLRKIIFVLGGKCPVDWNNKDEIQIEMVKLRNKEKYKLRPIHLFSEDGMKTHYWYVAWEEKISIGESINLEGNYRWKGFFNIDEDEFRFACLLPARHCKLQIFFPDDIKLADLSVQVQICHDEKLIYDYKINPVRDPQTQRAFVSTAFDLLIPGCSFKVKWICTHVSEPDKQAFTPKKTT